MMLSINIPVYNIDVRDLVLQLEKQGQKEHMEFEIRVYDDGSAGPVKLLNRSLAAHPHVIYREMDHNRGRAAIRNKMGFESAGDFLLFIDADSGLISTQYLKNYINRAKPGIIVCGGTAYAPQKPVKEKMLRWVYGIKREAVPAEVRTKKKGFIITSNNFLIDRKIFEKIHFRETPGPYGHEDTLFGFDLFTAGILPKHIDNPVEHTGLEDSDIFLNKTREALQNLHFIATETAGRSPEFHRRMNFLRQYKRMTRIIPPACLRLFYRTCSKSLEKHLTGNSPRIFWYDVYRLGYYAIISG